MTAATVPAPAPWPTRPLTCAFPPVRDGGARGGLWGVARPTPRWPPAPEASHGERERASYYPDRRAAGLRTTSASTLRDWKPVWYVLEERPFALDLVNAQHVKILPGRKSDVLGAEWLAELLEHGLLRGSFVPPPTIRELRGLTRYRKRLIQAHTAEGQRIEKTPEDAGIKLGSVASEVLGVSGRAMLGALVAGERDPEVLAEWAKGRCARRSPRCARHCADASATTTAS